MSGTKEGGAKAAATNKARHGEGFYAKIGSKGGRNGHTGGFAANPALARIAGAKGGRTSRRGKASEHKAFWEANKTNIMKDHEAGHTLVQLSSKYGLKYSVLQRLIRKEIYG